ncbi:MAG: hypothetical protein Q9221_000772 [Calogaya cf. arnoldii]
MDGVSIAASLVGLGTAGCQIAIKLYTLASQISTASQRISSVSNDVSLTAGVLKELGEFMTRETANNSTSIFSQSGLETTKNSAAICENIFAEIEQAVKEASEQLRPKTRIIGKIKLSKSEKLKWPFLQPSIESLRIDLREAKGTLMLMLQVTNLALSQRMATIHETTTTSLMEQKEIYRAILALQKQSQGNSSSQAKRLSIDRSSNGTPRVVSPPLLASPKDTREISSLGEKTSSGSPSLAGQAAAIPSLQALAATPGPSVLRKSELQATNDNSSSESIESIRETPRNDTKPGSNLSSPHGSNTQLPTAPIENPREQRTELMYLVVKAYITDDKKWPRGISLRFHGHQIPMQQVEIRKKLFSGKEEGFQPVLEAYLDLFDHERYIIEELVDDMDSRASLLLLKRTYTDMTYRGILFKGVPELQFILEKLMDDGRRSLAFDDDTWDERAQSIRGYSRRPSRYRNKSRPLRHAPSRSTSRSEVIEIERHRSPPRRQTPRGTVMIEECRRPPPPPVESVDEISTLLHPGFPKPVSMRQEDDLSDVDIRGMSDSSDDSSVDSITPDDGDAMNDEEAEKAVQELLGKYTTLVSGVAEVSGGGGTS